MQRPQTIPETPAHLRWSGAARCLTIPSLCTSHRQVQLQVKVHIVELVDVAEVVPQIQLQVEVQVVQLVDVDVESFACQFSGSCAV